MEIEKMKQITRIEWMASNPLQNKHHLQIAYFI